MHIWPYHSLRGCKYLEFSAQNPAFPLTGSYFIFFWLQEALSDYKAALYAGEWTMIDMKARPWKYSAFDFIIFLETGGPQTCSGAQQ